MLNFLSPWQNRYRDGWAISSHCDIVVHHSWFTDLVGGRSKEEREGKREKETEKTKKKKIVMDRKKGKVDIIQSHISQAGIFANTVMMVRCQSSTRVSETNWRMASLFFSLRISQLYIPLNIYFLQVSKDLMGRIKFLFLLYESCMNW